MPLTSRYDIAVIGAGILGLATAMTLLRRYPRLRVAVLEKEPRISAHQSGHNSGVIHRGVYYAPGSLKARLCVAGADQMLAFCAEHGIRTVACGKVIVAINAAELPALDELERRGIANGVPGLARIGRERLRELEPNCEGVAALHSPHTSIVDFRQVVAAMAAEIERDGGELRLGQEVLRIREVSDGLVIETSAGEVTASHLISCAGLHSDRVAGMELKGASRDLAIVPFRGSYYVLRPERSDVVRGLIYPVPDPRFPFLGVHFTRRIDGAIWVGPNAVLAFAREGYRRRDIRLSDLSATLAYPGFLRVARRYWRTGAAEMWRDVSKAAFAASLRRYVPTIEVADLLPGPSGVRAQAVRRDGTLVDDFVLEKSQRAIHVRNAPSPAATSALAIADLIASAAEGHFSLSR